MINLGSKRLVFKDKDSESEEILILCVRIRQIKLTEQFIMGQKSQQRSPDCHQNSLVIKFGKKENLKMRSRKQQMV